MRIYKIVPPCSKYCPADFLSIAEELDPVIAGAEYFCLKKHDLSTTVGVIKGEIFGLPHDIMVKRFNYKGLLNFLFKKIFGSRARRLWYINMKLYERGLPVAVPFAYLEPSFRRKNSFYLSSFIENSDNLGNIYKRGLFIEHGKIALILGQAIAQWHAAGAVHGDLKWSNILLQKNGHDWRFFFVDLDQAVFFGAINMRGVLKDLVRFYRYGLELGAEDWVDLEFLPAYMSSLPKGIQGTLDLAFIKERARKDREKKGRRTL